MNMSNKHEPVASTMEWGPSHKKWRSEKGEAFFTLNYTANDDETMASSIKLV